MKKVIGFMMMAVLIAFAVMGCTPKVEPVSEQGYDYTTVVTTDMAYVDSLYEGAIFYEAQVKYDTMLDMVEQPCIEYVMTVFQYGDTVILITHNQENFGEDPTVELINDHWLEDMECTPLVPVSLDSALIIVKATGPIPSTQYMTFRRPLTPPFPENGQYIFGKSTVVVDGVTGEVVYDERPVNDQDEPMEVPDSTL